MTDAAEDAGMVERRSRLARVSALVALLPLAGWCGLFLANTLLWRRLMAFEDVLFDGWWVVGGGITLVAFGLLLTAWVRIRRSWGALRGMGWCYLALLFTLLSGCSMVIVPAHRRSAALSKWGACCNNMRHIDSAKEQYALEVKLDDGDMVPADKVLAYIPEKIAWWDGGLPRCPVKGSEYAIGRLGEEPVCPNHGPIGNMHLPGEPPPGQ